MEEIWKDIAWYEGFYQISSYGRVKSLNYKHTGKEKILRPGKSKRGYLFVILYKEGKGKLVLIHRLVAQSFIPNQENLPQINHKDEIKTNNCVENLEWCTCQYNIDYSKSKKVLCIETNQVYKSIHEIERETGICYQNVFKCCIGKRKTAGGYHWKYV